VADNGDIIISSGTPDPDNSDNLLFLTSQVIGAINNVSIDDPFKANDLSVYPNPNSGSINFKGFSGVTGPVKAEVLNSLGQTVFSKPDFYLNESIDLAKMTQGIYFVQITESNSVRTIKLLRK
jgi:hypothetical protein